MANKLNAAIIILASRKELFGITLNHFYNNFNKKFKYPIYVHTFGKVFNVEEILSYKKKYKNISFHEINPAIPNHLKFKELFFYRFNNNFAFKGFNPLRLNYLHMLSFASNISSFGKQGCVVSKLKKYDYLMRIDDDSFFKKKIKKDFFQNLKRYPMATGKLAITKNSSIHLTREKLFYFLKNYVKKNNLRVKNKKLRNILSQKDQKKLYDLRFSLGNCDMYNMKEFKSDRFKKFIKAVNKFGGVYKYRWADYDLLCLYLYLFFQNPVLDLKFSSDIYSPAHPKTKKVFTNLSNIPSKYYVKILFFFIKKKLYKISRLKSLSV